MHSIAGQPGGPPADEAIRQRRARPWRMLALSGGLLLAATFLLPAVKGCNEDIIPYRELRSNYDSIRSFEDVSAAFLLYIAAYLFGLTVAVGTVRRTIGRHRLAHRPASGIMLVLCATWLQFAIAVIQEAGASGLDLEVVAGSMVAMIVAWYLFRALFKLGHRQHAAVTFLGALICTAWFAFWSVDGLHGVRLSLAGSVLILIGTIGETRALTRRGWWSTLGRLIIGRVRDIDLPPGSCPRCSYHLYGLTEQRCPECGRPFSFEELGVTPEMLAFNGGGRSSRPPSAKRRASAS